MTNYISAKTARRRHEAALFAYNDAAQKLKEAGEAVDRAQLDVLRSQLAAPSEPKVGSDVRFEVTYRHHTKPYTYIALRTAEGWLVTGKRHANKVYTWDEVLEIADRGIADPNLQVREVS